MNIPVCMLLILMCISNHKEEFNRWNLLLILWLLFDFSSLPRDAQAQQIFKCFKHDMFICVTYLIQGKKFYLSFKFEKKPPTCHSFARSINVLGFFLLLYNCSWSIALVMSLKCGKLIEKKVVKREEKRIVPRKIEFQWYDKSNWAFNCCFLCFFFFFCGRMSPK